MYHIIKMTFLWNPRLSFSVEKIHSILFFSSNSCLDSQERAQPCAWSKLDFDAIRHEVSISSQDGELICDFLIFSNFSPYAYPGQWNRLTVQDKPVWTIFDKKR